MNQEQTRQQASSDVWSSAVNMWPLAAVMAAFYGYCEAFSEVIAPPSFESKK